MSQKPTTARVSTGNTAPGHIESQLILEPTASGETDTALRPNYLREHADYRGIRLLIFPDDVGKAYWDLMMLV